MSSGSCQLSLIQSNDAILFFPQMGIRIFTLVRLAASFLPAVGDTKTNDV